jgi:cell division septal protein FtsQ
MTFALLKSATTQLQNAEKVSRLAGIDTKNIEAAMRVLKINIWLWFFVWIASVGAGISAAVIMLFFYARGILQI